MEQVAAVPASGLMPPLEEHGPVHPGTYRRTGNPQQQLLKDKTMICQLQFSGKGNGLLSALPSCSLGFI